MIESYDGVRGTKSANYYKILLCNYLPYPIKASAVNLDELERMTGISGGIFARFEGIGLL